MTNKGLLPNQSINKKKRNNQLKLNKKLKQTFHRRGKLMTFCEYTERYSSSLATPEGHVDVSITHHLRGFCVARSVRQ